MGSERPPDADDVVAGAPFDALARLACAVPEVSGVAIFRRVAEGWSEVARFGARCDGASVRRALASIDVPRQAASDVDAARVIAVRAAAGGIVGALVVAGPPPHAAALGLLAAQAAALFELDEAAGHRAAVERRARFAARLEGRLRAARTPERVVAATIDEVRSELDADSVSFGLLSGGGTVTVETSRQGVPAGVARRMPLAAFGLDGSLRGLDAPITFPTAASATVPLSSDGRLAALLHLQARASRDWSRHDLGLAAEAAGMLWRERARAVCEAELRARESRLNALLGSVSDGFYALDADWRFTVFNRAAERFFGTSFDRVEGRTLREVFPEVARSGLETHLARVMASGVPAAMEMRSAARPDRTVEIRAAAQAGGGVAVTFSDVTERRERLDELRGIEERLTALLGHARAGICETTLDGRFLSANPRFCEIVGRSEAELLRLDQASITLPVDVERSLDLCRRMVATGEGFTIEKRYVRPAGPPVAVANAVGLLNGRGGRTALAIVVAPS